MRSPVFGFLVGLAVAFFYAQSAEAQVVLTAGNVVTDSFPIIDVDVSVTQSGAPAPLVTTANFTVRENGVPASVLTLKGCGGTSSAAIALVMDTSASMNESIGSGPITNREYDKFNAGIAAFVASLPGPSLLALVPFADSSKYWYPGSPTNFYTSNNTADTAALMAHVLNLSYDGSSTEVTDGIDEAAMVLAKSSLPSRAMILITDDNATNVDSVRMMLASLGIKLYVLDVARDSGKVNYINHDLAIATGGDYFHASDTTMYTQEFLAISQKMFAEHCVLEYRSAFPCSAWNTVNVDITLNYKGSVENALVSYLRGAPAGDTVAPRLKLDTPAYISRRIRAYDFFPCESGMRSLLDSSSMNVTVIPRYATADSIVDLVTATDSLYPARAWFVASDSAGNRNRMELFYLPKPDLHPPQMSVPLRAGSNYTAAVHEALPWDRGIDTVFLVRASNLLLDSVVFSGKSLAMSYLHISYTTDSAQGCLIARDSAGNLDSVCIEWYGEGADTLPPVFTQDPIAEPRTELTGIVTEERPKDRGLREVNVTPLGNTSVPFVSYNSVQAAKVGIGVIDSLFAARALIEAYDSAGNYMRDTMRYEPLDDQFPPVLHYRTVRPGTLVFSASDTQAWDRGVAFLLLTAGTNASTGNAIFSDGHHASLTVTIGDQALPSTITVQATDSAGYQTTLTITVPAVSLQTFGDTAIDFGVIPVNRTVTRTLVLTNENDIPIACGFDPLIGDTSEFLVISPNPMFFAAHATEAVSFEFHPAQIGSYRAASNIEFHSPLGTVNLTGRSIGAVQLALDTVIVTSGTAGAMHLAVDVDPKPSNLDTIAFVLNYDPDLITFDPLPLCSSGIDTGLCGYVFSWSGPEGAKEGMLVRKDNSLTTLTFGSSSLTLPFESYAGVFDSARVTITPINTYSGKTLSTQNGLVVFSDACGDPMLRSAMRGDAIVLRIANVVPNPAFSSIRITVESAHETAAEIRLIGMMGAIVKSVPVHLMKGRQEVVITDLPSGSGAYGIMVRTGEGLSAVEAVEIVH